MFFRILGKSLLLRRRRRFAAFASVALGTAAASGILAVFFSVGDSVAAELRRYGANLLVTPAGAALDVGATLAESDLARIKGEANFWRNNVVGFAPFLAVDAAVDGRPTRVVGTWVDRELAADGEAFRAGLRSIASAWRVEGAWMSAPDEAMAGASLARDRGLRTGSRVRVRDADLRVVGVVSSGGAEDGQLLVDLSVAQSLAGRPGRVGWILASAVTTPESHLAERAGGGGGSLRALARQMRTDPTRLPPDLVEQFACTPYPTSIAIQIEKSLPHSDARPIRQATETEGAVLERVRAAFLLLAASAAVASALGVLAAATSSVLDRGAEIGLWKALGATDARVALLLLSEASLVGIAGGVAGVALGAAAARAIGSSAFGVPFAFPPALAALAVLGALAVSILGSALPMRAVVRLRPTVALHRA